MLFRSRGESTATFGDTSEAVRMALRALRANLFRTVLTLLGIVIGVASVVVMLAVGNGARQEVVERISDMGTHLLIVRPGAPNTRRSADGSTNTLTAEDAAVAATIDNVVAAVPEVQTRATVRAGNTDAQTSITGTTAEFVAANSWPVANGVFINDEDNRRYAAVAVIGRTVANNLYSDRDPLGEYMLIGNVPFLIIGVMQEKGATPWGQDQDDVVFVPLNTATNQIGRAHV